MRCRFHRGSPQHRSKTTRDILWRCEEDVKGRLDRWIARFASPPDELRPDTTFTFTVTTLDMFCGPSSHLAPSRDPPVPWPQLSSLQQTHSSPLPPSHASTPPHPRRKKQGQFKPLFPSPWIHPHLHSNAIWIQAPDPATAASEPDPDPNPDPRAPSAAALARLTQRRRTQTQTQTLPCGSVEGGIKC